jgi:prepilin-type N-terminal cleavage/methylation domain-containing protein
MENEMKLPTVHFQRPIVSRRFFNSIGSRQSKTGNGFTLIEVMIAIAIFSMVLAAIYSTWYLIARGTRTAQTVAAEIQRERVTINSIEDSLTCIRSFQASPQYYSFVVENGSSPLLEFTARLPDDFLRSGRFGSFNVRRLAFTVEPPPNPGNAFVVNTGEKDLVLRQYPILTGMDADEKAAPLVLARNVQLFAVECWDTNKQDWVDEWDDTNSIPPMIRVDLSFGADKNNFGNVSPTFSVSRLIAVPAQMMPASVQIPNGANGGSGGGPGLNLNIGGKNLKVGGQ